MSDAVVDASVVVDFLLAGSPDLVATLGAYEDLHAPNHLDIECLSALRGRVMGGHVTSDQCAASALSIARMPISRYAPTPLVPRILALAANASAYDAAYIALAEALDADLLTTDSRLAKVPGIACRVRVL